MLMYALTGAVVPGLEREISQCLDRVEHGHLDAGLDPVDEHARLLTLLHHVEPDLAAQRAVGVGHADGVMAAAGWRRDVLGGQVASDSEATARRVLQGIEDEDPALIEMVPGWDQVATGPEIAGRSGWPEPHVDDRAAHDRWEAAQPRICDAYAGAFVVAFWTSVGEHCLTELAGRDLAATAVNPDRPGCPVQRDGRDRAAAVRHTLDRLDPPHPPSEAATQPTPTRGLAL
jgi:hypothetical protein